MRLIAKNRPSLAQSTEKVRKWGTLSNKAIQPQQPDFQEQIPREKNLYSNMLQPHHGNVNGEVKGVNSALETFNILVSGTTGGHLWTANLSSWPGQQKRLLTILGGSTFLVNYALDSYPSRINILINEATGSLDEHGNSSHAIAALVPSGPATPVQNPGNIIGYNVTYHLLSPLPPLDISNLPQLTFDVSADNSSTPVSYPIASAISLIIQITHVMF